MDPKSERQFLLHELQESALCREATVDSLDELQQMYLQLLKQYAQAKNYIDQLRLQRGNLSSPQSNTDLNVKVPRYEISTQSAPNLHTNYSSDKVNGNEYNSLLIKNQTYHISQSDTNTVHVYEVPNRSNNLQITTDSVLPSSEQYFPKNSSESSVDIPSDKDDDKCIKDIVLNESFEYLPTVEANQIIFPFSSREEPRESNFDYSKNCEGRTVTPVLKSQDSSLVHNENDSLATVLERHLEINEDKQNAWNQKVNNPSSHLWANTILKHNKIFLPNKPNATRRASLAKFQTVEYEVDSECSIPKDTLTVDHLKNRFSPVHSSEDITSTDESDDQFSNADYADSSCSESPTSSKSQSPLNCQNHKGCHTRSSPTKIPILVKNITINASENLKWEIKKVQNHKTCPQNSSSDVHELKVRTYSGDKHNRRTLNTKIRRKSLPCMYDSSCSVVQVKGQNCPPSLKAFSSSGISSQDSIMVSDNGFHSPQLNKCGRCRLADRAIHRRVLKGFKNSRSASVERQSARTTKSHEIYSECTTCCIQEKKHLSDALDLAIQLAQGLQKQSAELLS